MASNLVVLAFDGAQAADTMYSAIKKMEDDGSLKISDAVIARRGPHATNVDIEQTQSRTRKYAGRGGAIGLVAGFLLGGPLGAMAAGATIGAIAGSMENYGTDSNFVREVSEALKPDSSALFLLIDEADADAVLVYLRPFKARVLTTTLPPEMEDTLRKALDREEY